MTNRARAFSAPPYFFQNLGLGIRGASLDTDKTQTLPTHSTRYSKLLIATDPSLKPLSQRPFRGALPV